MWRDIGSYGKAPRFGPLAVESRQVLKLFSYFALIVVREDVPFGGYSVAQKVPPGRALGRLGFESFL